MARGFGPTTILKAFQAGERVMGVRPDGWLGGHSNAKLFVERQMGWRDGLKDFPANNLKGLATTDYEELLKTIKLWKMRLTPPPQCGPGAVYMISLLNDLVNWSVAGEKVFRQWPEFLLKPSTASAWSCSETTEPVIMVKTENRGTVRMVRWPNQLNDWEIITTIEKIETSLTPGYEEDFTGYQIPCVLAEWEPVMDWVMALTNEAWFIAFAKQLIAFGMNEKGFAQREEFQAIAMKAVFGGPYILSPEGESFLFWRRQGSLPVSAYQFDQTDFKDPGDLKKIVE